MLKVEFRVLLLYKWQEFEKDRRMLIGKNFMEVKCVIVDEATIIVLRYVVFTELSNNSVSHY